MLKKLLASIICVFTASCTATNGEEYASHGMIPIQMPITLHQKGIEQSAEMIVPKHDKYAIYLVFARPNFDNSTNQANELDAQLSDLLSKMDLRTEKSQATPEKIHFIVEVQNLDTNKMVVQENVDFDNQEKYHYSADLLDEKSRTLMITAPDKHSIFELEKGRYRLVFRNQYDSKAYAPYQVYLQVSKPYRLSK